MNNICDGIKAARGIKKVELVFKDISIINVFTQEIEQGDIAVSNGEIVGIGTYFGETEIQCTGLYAAPGFIDAHVHIESSMVTPKVFSRELLRRGVTAVIADPHEIANVLGSSGIEFMLENSKDSLIDIHYMMPSCVPAVDFEDNGGRLEAKQLAKFKKVKGVLGLGEIMDVGAVLECKAGMIEKIRSFSSYKLDGHAPGLSDKELNGYIFAGVTTDHECGSATEALEKVRRGMYVLIREGSAAKDLEELLPAVSDSNYHRFMFCTDDRHADDLLKEGSIDYVVRKAISCGLEPVRAITMASFNAAVCYGLRKTGALAPGYKADIIIFDDLKNIAIKYVIKSGKLYNNSEDCIIDAKTIQPDMNRLASMNIMPVTTRQFKINARGKSVNAIKITPGSLLTRKVCINFKEQDGYIIGLQDEDALKIAVFERHKGTGRYSLGFVKGFGLHNCSIAQTIAHDSHNIMVIGDSDEDMATAVNTLIGFGGGVVVVSEGEIKALVKLPVAGLMSVESLHEVAEKIDYVRRVIDKYRKSPDFDILLTLGFLSLPVIPDIKITSRGLFNYGNFDFIDLCNDI